MEEERCLFLNKMSHKILSDSRLNHGDIKKGSKVLSLVSMRPGHAVDED